MQFVVHGKLMNVLHVYVSLMAQQNVLKKHAII